MILERLGFIGLGAMGSRMAANLQKSGTRLVVFNRTRDKATSLVSQGATWADTPAAVGEQVEVLFTMLAHPAAVQETALGKNGFLGRLRPEGLVNERHFSAGEKERMDDLARRSS